MIFLQQKVSSMFKSLIIFKKNSVAFFRNFIEVVRTMQKKSEQEKNSKWVGAGGGGGGGRKKILIRTLLNYSGETLSPVNVYFLFFNSMLCFFPVMLIPVY